MKTKYKWMNDGKEFELPDFNQMNPQQQLDLLHFKIKAEKDFKDIKPEGTRPKEKDMTQDWILYLNMISNQGSIDMVVYALKEIDPKITKEIILKHLDTNGIAEVLNQLFRVGRTITPKKKKTDGQPEKKS